MKIARFSVVLNKFCVSCFVPLFGLHDKMATNSDRMDSESILDTEVVSEDVNNVTLSTLMVAIKDITKTMERKFVEMESSLEKKLTDSILKVCEAKIGQVKKEFHTEITKITDRLTIVENRDSTQCNGHTDPRKMNFIVRNMNEREGENVRNRVSGLIKDDLRINDVSVVSAERKVSRNRKPGVIVASCKSEQDVVKVLKNKKALKNHRQYEQVYVEPDVPLEQRIQKSNFRNIVSVIGEDKLELRGSRVFPRSADHHLDDRNDSDSGLGQNNNDWEVQSSRKRRRLDRSNSRDSRRSRERDSSPVNDRRPLRNRSHDRQRDNGARDSGSSRPSDNGRQNRDNFRPDQEHRNAEHRNRNNQRKPHGRSSR